MGGNYEEVNEEKKQAIVKFMTLVTNIVKQNAESRVEIPISMEKSTPTTTTMKVKDTKMIDLSSQISIGIDIMQVGATKVIVNVT